MSYHVCNKVKVRGRVDLRDDYGVDIAGFQLRFVSRQRQIRERQASVPLLSSPLELSQSLRH